MGDQEMSDAERELANEIDSWWRKTKEFGKGPAMIKAKVVIAELADKLQIIKDAVEEIADRDTIHSTGYIKYTYKRAAKIATQKLKNAMYDFKKYKGLSKTMITNANTDIDTPFSMEDQMFV